MITVECKECGHRQSTDADAVIEGIECQNCKSTLRLDDGTASTIYNSQGTHHYECCPKCRCEINCDPSDNKPLIVCTGCDRIFIHSKLTKLSSRKSDWSNEQILRAVEKVNPDKELAATINSYDSQDVRAVKQLGIYGIEQSPDLAQPLLQSIFYRADRTFDRIFPNYNMLPAEMRLRLCVVLSKSPYIRKFFFGEPLTQDELKPVVSSVLLDDNLYAALCVNFNNGILGVVASHMREFIKVVYETEPTAELLKFVVFKIFSQGLDGAIKDTALFIHYSDTGQVRPTTDLSARGRSFIYRKDNELNNSLREVCAQCGIEEGNKRGCLMTLLFIFLVFIGITMGIGVYL